MNSVFQFWRYVGPLRGMLYLLILILSLTAIFFNGRHPKVRIDDVSHADCAGHRTDAVFCHSAGHDNVQDHDVRSRCAGTQTLPAYRRTGRTVFRGIARRLVSFLFPVAERLSRFSPRAAESDWQGPRRFPYLRSVQRFLETR